ncbi:MAG: hypothetical protein DMF73_10830 [Acidobacteria bacterium]|nr:MAG: hypothetical protein DMF73_10830 [Acidobacteriota bacterium]
MQWRPNNALHSDAPASRVSLARDARSAPASADVRFFLSARNMRATIGILVLVFSGLSLAADESAILSIRKEYQSIQNALPSLKGETVDLPDYSTEGADATAYRDRTGNIRALKAGLFFESGKQYENFYYKNGMLIFAFYQFHRYNQHPGITPEIAKKEWMEPFDPKKTTITEDRYYFEKGKMIRWLDQNKNEVKPDSKEFKEAEKDVTGRSNEMLSKFKRKT